MAGELTARDKVEWELLSAPGEWPAEWPTWVRDSLKKFEAIEPLMFKWIPVASRLWVAKLCTYIIAEFCPTIAQADPAVSGPRLLGRAVGHQLECLQLLEESWEKAKKEIEDIDERLRQKLHPKVYARLLKKSQRYTEDFEHFLTDFAKIADDKLTLCNEIQALAQQQPRAESADFSIGVGEARASEIVSNKGELIVGGYRMKLYLLLVAFWRFVEKFNSSVQLYRWSCIWLGQAQVGDIFTFQRLCRRYSIRLGVRGKRVSKRRMRRRKRTR